MEAERLGGGVVPSSLQVSFSTSTSNSTTPQGNIHELGFVQFEENQVLSFMSPSQHISSHHHHQITTPPITTTASTGFTAGQGNNQVGTLDPKTTVNDDGNANNGSNDSWYVQRNYHFPHHMP
ncbi:WRKY transcription factor 25 [Tripterygium wilfordii]|uniref:WRKY transcription factor 25 n=1 Tax=Tripterygium wilfordii TaxID=458696 RepID=A0A7J7CFE8_TRIWF|nr:WRKY transcription factor 25 [Tripterygium wilfordii]